MIVMGKNTGVIELKSAWMMGGRCIIKLTFFKSKNWEELTERESQLEEQKK